MHVLWKWKHVDCGSADVADVMWVGVKTNPGQHSLDET